MSAGATPNPPSSVPGQDPALACKITADAYHHLVHTLRLALPPPVTASPEDRRRRDHAAIACVAAFAPANAAEAELAAQFVAAEEQSKHCLRLAQLPETTPELAAKCRAQAAGMMRQTNSALRLLLRLQQARRRLEADSAACDRAAWAEHCALGLMAQALADEPVPAAEPALAEPMPEAQPDAPQAAPPAADADPVSTAEKDATVHPRRTVIRSVARLSESAANGVAGALEDPDRGMRETALPNAHAA